MEFVDDIKIGVSNNRNYSRGLELISEFDPFLAGHIQNIGSGKGST